MIINSFLFAPVSTLWNNLVAYFTGDNTPNDSKGIYNGTLTNGATYATGKINNGFSTDGVNDYVAISPTLGSSFSSPTSAHSYSAWVYPTISPPVYSFIIQNGKNDIGTSMVLSSDQLIFFYKGGFNVASVSGAIPTINTWYHIVTTYDGAGTVKFYVNGVLKQTSTISWTDGTGTCNTYIGSYLGTGNFFKGTIDEVACFTTNITQAQVTELYNSGAGKQYPN